MSRLASPTVTHVGLEHAWLSWPAPPNATSAFAEYAVHAIDVATNAPLLSVGGAVGRQFARVDGLQPGRSYRFSVQQSAGGRVVGEPSALSPPATTAAAADVVLLAGGPAPAADDGVVVLRHLQSLGLVVRVAPAEAAPRRLLERARLLVVAGSCDRASLAGWTAGPLRTPALALGPGGWEALGLATASGARVGAWARVAADRPLGAALGAGRIALYRHPAALHHAATLAAGAAVILHPTAARRPASRFEARSGAARRRRWGSTGRRPRRRAPARARCSRRRSAGRWAADRAAAAGAAAAGVRRRRCTSCSRGRGAGRRRC